MTKPTKINNLSLHNIFIKVYMANYFSKRKIAFFFFLLIQLTNYGQATNEITDNIPMTPESYAFKKRFNYELSNYTGTTNIDIPIHNIKTKDIEIPISISYTTGGIKVEEEASIVGLGWCLRLHFK